MDLEKKISEKQIQQIKLDHKENKKLIEELVLFCIKNIKTFKRLISNQENTRVWNKEYE